MVIISEEEVEVQSVPVEKPKESGNPQSPPVEAEKPKPAAAEEKKPERQRPNKENGLDMENYTWGQTLQEVTINVAVPAGTNARSVVCEIKKNHIKIGLKNQDPVLEGELLEPIKPEDSFWSLEDKKNVSVLLTKAKKNSNWWKSLVKGGPEIDTKKVEPETSKLADLDLETRAAVEKMMFDQRQKQMGRPTSQEMEQQEMMKKLREQFPDMDLSKMMAGGGGGNMMMGGGGD
ncbi:OLC1v1002559C1 [Oldenlandia corymbosa var. corymbosa]|uniref:OLC1v1002559C1 n=1 Tax=Oldenlandia corymbosa var. corymbosa TaxID=529605 RepID=A0AAV1D7X1_OLDCO|nr:OLC1v1002559C1 [Oldenlandia corymbosa var. corymbosa]